ncbi:hypothetical protein [Jiangella anatolica]|uniref:hypothetical protein n=1 Tax=Jiangella anatolica TaxID=2670374 RepID=UPI001314A012|nr:hypothetical protein [Jiangella anatolica]
MPVFSSRGVTWSGYKTELCSVLGCLKLFSNTRAGDAHRVGEHGVTEGPDRRRCLTTEEMLAKSIEKGSRKGEPFYRTRINPWGHEVWSINVPDARWDVQRQFVEASLGTPLGTETGEAA